MIVSIPQSKVGQKSTSPSVKRICIRLKVLGLVTSPSKTMMITAQHAFRQAINKDKAQQIDNDWEIIQGTLLLTKITTDDIYERFKEHYTKHLKDWTRNMLDPSKPTGKANVLVEQTNKLVDLRVIIFVVTRCKLVTHTL